jgi:hypothetical protein
LWLSAKPAQRNKLVKIGESALVFGVSREFGSPVTYLATCKKLKDLHSRWARKSDGNAGDDGIG